jgi:hypothetical protein
MLKCIKFYYISVLNFFQGSIFRPVWLGLRSGPPLEQVLVVNIVGIVSATGTEDRGFESRQCVRFLGVYAIIAMLFFVT